MDKLNFQWEAIFKDGKIIPQYEEDKEHPFSEVRENFSDLVLFKIKHICLPLEIAVDLTRGLLFYNLGCGMELYEAIGSVDPDFIKEKENIRLIYFRRHTHQLSAQLDELAHTLVYFIGYQYTINGINHKVIVQVDNNGHLTIGD